MVKKGVVILLGVLLLSLTGCGTKKVEEKLAEKITEGILDKAGGDNVDIDLDEGKITVTDKEGGAEWTVGGGEWPKGEAASLIPKFTKGKVESVIETPEACMISLSEVSQKDYENYVEELKSAGFNEEVTTSTAEDTIMYSAKKGEKAGVLAMFTDGANMTISVEMFE